MILAVHIPPADEAAETPVTADEEAALHRRLAGFNARRLAPSGPCDRWAEGLADELDLRRCEHAFVERERRAIGHLLPDLPPGPASFCAWFEALADDGPGQGDPLFPWLAEEATLAQMRWFLTQEAAGEAGFDDLVALTQVKLPERPKLELARNYWDEMGRGHADGMHGRMLGRLVELMALPVAIPTTVWPALALGNLLVALATDRQYAYHSLGALGVIELTAPGRVALVRRGLARLGFSPADRAYFEIHATLDIKHARGWIAEALLPVVGDRPEAAGWIAEGALMRLAAGARCFAHYRRVLMPTGQSQSM